MNQSQKQKPAGAGASPPGVPLVVDGEFRLGVHVLGREEADAPLVPHLPGATPRQTLSHPGPLAMSYKGISVLTFHFSALQFGSHEWLMKRALPPFSVASMAC